MNLKSTKNSPWRFPKGMLRRVICVCSALLLVGQLAYGQARKVTGTVTGPEGDPLAGVTVVLQGTSRGVTTDAKGKYTIQINKDNDVLNFNFIGMLPVSENVGKRSAIDVAMKDDAQSIETVVVEVGYGQVRKVDLTGSVGMIGGSDLMKTPVSSATEALTGKIAGLSIVTAEGSPGADITVKVRGGTSITQDNSPLYIIDGFPEESGLNNLDASQIESISVLKDASSTSIYGARGANGVILVTTKSASGGKLQVSYNGSFSVREMSKYLDVMTPFDYVVLRFEQDAKNAVVDGVTNPSWVKKWGSDWYDLWDVYGNMEPVDWQKQMSRTGYMQNHSLEVRGGSEQTRLIANVGYVKETGVLINSSLEKKLAALRVTHETKDKRVKLNFSMNFTETSVTGDRQYGRSGKMIGAVMHRPMPTAEEDIDTFFDETYDSETLTSNSANDYMVNPVVENSKEFKEETKRALTFKSSVDWYIIKELRLSAYAGLNTGWNYNDRAWFSDHSSALVNGGPYAQISNGSNRRWNANTTLTYTKKINGGHNVSAMVGTEAISSFSRSLSVKSSAFESDAIMLDRMSLGTVPGIPTSDVNQSAVASFFGRVSYDYKGRYLFNANMRADGSSVFAPGNHWGYFPSAAFAWRLSEEPFMKKYDWLDQAKVRVSYGLSGNNRIDSDQWRTIYDFGTLGLLDTSNTSAFVSALPNKNLKWESVIDLDLGLDISIFNGRFGATIDVYKRTSKDLLLKAPRNTVSGFKTYFANVGKTENRGLEVSFNTLNIQTRDFQWSTDFNISFNRNVVKELAEGDYFFESSNFYKQTIADYIVKVGEPIGSMYGYVLHPNKYYRTEDFIENPAKPGTYILKDGIAYVGYDATDVSKQPQPGNPRYVSLNDDLNITADDDRTIIGNAQPKFYGGFNNTFIYKGWDLSAFINFTYGNDIYNANRFRFNSSYSSKQNMLAEMRNRFMTIDENCALLVTSDRLMTNLLELERVNRNATTYTPYAAMAQNHSGYIEDGSYLRLSTLTLGYTFPKKWMRKVGISNLRIYATGSNLWTWTNYTGFDPEVDSYSSKNSVVMGLDYSAYPKYRSYVFGVNLTF